MDAVLSKLKKGEKGVVKQLEGGIEFQRKVSSMGIIVGKKIKMLFCQPLNGPIVVKIGNMEVALGRGMAGKIIVKK